MYITEKKRIEKYTTLANNFFSINGMKIDKKKIKNYEIQWLMLNIGIFLKKHGENV